MQFSSRGSAVVARLTGELDLSNAEDVGMALAQATPNHAHALVVDLSGVEYLDSAGIQLIYRLREGLRARGQTLQLVIPAASPSNDALRLAGVERHIETIENVDDALGELG